jgi:hypothetical protein
MYTSRLSRWLVRLFPSIVNARHMRTRVTVVSLFICYHSTACIRRLCNKMNVPANFTLNSKGFQLRDFAKKLSVTCYRIFFVIAWPFFSITARAPYYSSIM